MKSERNKYETQRHTFAEDRSFSPAALQMIADVVGHSLSSFKEREEASKKYYKALQEAEARRAALSPEQRAAEDKARQDKIDQQEWDDAVNAGIMCAIMRSQGYDVDTPKPFPQKE